MIANLVIFDTYGTIVLYNPPNPSEYRVPDDINSNCLSSAYIAPSIASIGKVLNMGGFNLPNEKWTRFPGISTENFCETEIFFTDKCFTQLITEPTQKDGILDFVFTNYDESEV